MVSLAGYGQTSSGLEIVQTNVLVQVFENLETQLKRQADAWDLVDRSLADKLGQSYKPTKLEFPPRSSYYPGGRLGILGMPDEAFPAVSVMADRFDPAATSPSINGYGAESSINVYIEAIVRSDPFWAGDPDPSPEQRVERVYQEGLVDRRAKRMIEALLGCIGIDKTFGAVVPSDYQVSGGQTDAFTLPGSEPNSPDGDKRVFSLVRVSLTPSSLALWPGDAPVLPSHFGS